MAQERICEECGKIYKIISHKQRFCTKTCSHLVKTRAHAEKWANPKPKKRGSWEPIVINSNVTRRTFIDPEDGKFYKIRGISEKAAKKTK